MGSRGRVGRSATVISLEIRSSLGFRIRFRFGVDVHSRSLSVVVCWRGWAHATEGL